MSILRQFVALNAHSTTEEEKSLNKDDTAAESFSSLSRARRHAEDNNGMGTSATTEPPKTTKKTKAELMKNRIYTSQISYPSITGGGNTGSGARV